MVVSLSTLLQLYANRVELTVQRLLPACHKIVQPLAGPTEQDTDIAAARAAGFIHQAGVGSLCAKFIMASIEYAETVVNTESPQALDIRRVLTEHACRRAPRFRHCDGRRHKSRTSF